MKHFKFFQSQSKPKSKSNIETVSKSKSNIKTVSNSYSESDNDNLTGSMSSSSTQNPTMSDDETKSETSILQEDKGPKDEASDASDTLTGRDLYSIFSKRKRSPEQPDSNITTNIVKKTTKSIQFNLELNNKFEPLAPTVAPTAEPAEESAAKIQEPINPKENDILKGKPAPFFVRGSNSIGVLSGLLKECKLEGFEIKLLNNGEQARVQTKTIADYMIVQKMLTSKNIAFYTYQLKHERGYKVIMKGLDPRTNIDEIKEELTRLNFKPREVSNIVNSKGIKTTMFAIVLEPEKFNKTKHHPIYDVNRFMHLVVKVEEPIKKKALIQCHRCQEFGHTKTYCRLMAICAICANKHLTSECDKDKTDATVKLCNNCGEAHTANWRGCEVYKTLSESKFKPPRKKRPEFTNTSVENKRPAVSKTNGQFTFANVADPNFGLDSNKIIELMLLMQTNFNNMQATISEMLTKQNSMESSINELAKNLNKIIKQNDQR